MHGRRTSARRDGRSACVPVLIALIVGVASPALAQGRPSLVKDINTKAAGTGAKNLTAFDGALFFAGRDLEHGFELWRSDGTEQGTTLVKDIVPGPVGAIVSQLTPSVDQLFFVVDDGVHGAELWSSDGSGPGTHLVKDVLPGPGGSSPTLLVNADGLLFFVADDGVHGAELWVSDGTGQGTALVADIHPGSAGAAIEEMVAVGNAVVFAADDGSHGSELWTSDGTPQGTFMIEDIRPGAQGSDPASLASFGGKVFFAADDGFAGRELWQSDLSAHGAARVADLWPGPDGSQPSGLIVSGATLFFVAQSGPAAGLELWGSDGTENGTQQLTNPSAQGSYPAQPHDLVDADGTLYFVAFDPVGGSTLWKSDGTVPGTKMVKDLAHYPCSNEFTRLKAAGKRLFFAARFPDEELWTTDGTDAGTHLVKDIFPGNGLYPSNQSSHPWDFAAIGDVLYFTALDGLHGRELWRSDGTDGGTRLVKDILLGATEPSVSYGTMLALNGQSLFVANGSELWKSDGTAAGTVKVPGTDGIPADWIMGVGTHSAYFPSYSRTVFDVSLWKTDGTTTTLADDLGQIAGAVFASGAVFGDTLYVGIRGASYDSLLLTDGTPAGTQQLGRFTDAPSWFAKLPQTVLFRAGDAAHGHELWKTDGTPQGTALVADVKPGRGDGLTYDEDVITMGRRLFFVADDGVHGRELWVSNGTAAGTRLVRDINPGKADGIDFLSALRLRRTLFFTANDGVTGRELWKTDGTAAGTTLVKDIAPGPADSYAGGFGGEGFAALGGQVLFVASGARGGQLWRSDGTATGTTLIAEMFASIPANLTRVGDVVYFTVDDGKHGEELWVTDGTPGGTRLAADVNQGPESSKISQLLNVGGRLFFFADDGIHGSEPWALSCGNGVVDPDEQCDLGARNGDGVSCCTGTCQLRDPGAPCHTSAGSLELRRARLQADGANPADTGSVIVDGYLTVAADPPGSFQPTAGLAVSVATGAGFHDVVEWPGAECAGTPSGVIHCQHANAKATFRPVAGGAAGSQRYFFSVSARRLAIAGPFGTPLDVVVTTGNAFDRTGSLASCSESDSALSCHR